jgi:hypothetical protein
MTNHRYIQVRVGYELRVVDMDLFITVHEELAEHYRAEGLRGDALDHAICDALPQRLAEVLDEPRSTRH